MTTSSEDREELLELADRLCEGRLAVPDAARLNQLLRDSAELRQCFLAYRDLHASLAWNGRGSRVDAAIFTLSPPATAAAPRSRSYVAGQHIARAARHLRTWPQSGMFAAAAALLLLLSLAWWLWPESPVAQITRVHDAVWADEAESFASAEQQAVALYPGQQLRLTSGLAEVRFGSGAYVVLEGPATFVVAGENAASLNLGKLVAQVPPAAHGFEVVTPAANIIDRGTEFALWVQPPSAGEQESATEVHVLAGRVEVAPQPAAKYKIGAPATAGHPKSKIVSTGKAVRTEHAGVALTEIDILPEQFVRTLPGALVAVEDFENRPPGAVQTDADRRVLYERTDSGREQTIRVVEPADLKDARFGRHVLEIRDNDATRKMPGPVFDLLLPESLARQPVQVRFDFRILNPASHPLVTVYNRSWYLELGPQLALEQSRLGSLEPNQWYRATLDLPAVSADPATARVRIEKLANGRFVDSQTLTATQVRNLPGDAVRFGFHSPQIQPAGGAWQIDNVEVRAHENEETSL